jgi:large subunit ribosomal protein L23
LNATKSQIKDAVETLFDVRVSRVNVMVMPAKRSRKGMGRRMVTRKPMYKKALVTLEPGEFIDVFEGV